MGVYNRDMKQAIPVFGLAVCIALGVMAGRAAANPTSYPGGTMVMIENSAMENSLLANYTFAPNYAIGYRALYDRDTQATFHGAQLNYLAKRWNNSDSQGNIYFSGAVGAIDMPSRSDNAWEPAGLVGMQADWESRRYFTLYENKWKVADDKSQTEFTQTARLGVAPYVAEFGSLHTWLMVQFDHTPDQQDHFSTTPLVRFFYNAYLLEAGYNIDEGKPMLNATIRF